MADSSSDAGKRPLPRAVWVLGVVSFFADVSSEMIYPLLPLFLVGTLGESATALGAVEGAAVLVVSLVSATAGWRSDAVRRRVPWIRAGYGLPVVGKALIALAAGWGLVLAGRLVDRTGKGLRGAPRDALIAGLVPEHQRGSAFGVHRAFDTAGALVGVLASALLLWWLAGSPEPGEAAAAVVPEGAYRAVFALAAALGLASFALTWLVSEDRAEPSPPLAPPAPAALGLPTAYWTALAALLLFAVANSSDAFLLLRASDLGLTPWSVVLAYALYNLLYASVSYPAGAVSDRFGRWGVIALGWLLYAAVYAGFAFAPAWGVWPLMALYGVYMGLTDGVGKALLADRVPRERRGTALGVFHASTGIVALASSVLAGVVWDRVGPSATFLLGAAFALVALLALGIARAASRGARTR